MAPRTSTALGLDLGPRPPRADGADCKTSSSPEADAASAAKTRVKAGWSWNPMSLTWTEQYNESLEKAWSRVPGGLRKVIVTLAVFAVGLAMSGDWLVILVHFRRQLGLDPIPDGKPFSATVSHIVDTYFKNFFQFWIPSIIVSYGIYFAMGGFLHWYFYVRQRESAKEWKCQPNSWLSPELELHEIKVGVVSLLVTCTMTALVSCYVYNGGWCRVFYRWDEYGYAWFFLQWPAIFLFQDYATYLLHRLYHTPWLYKHFHKLHHTYKHPTAFSVTAIHPVEVLNVQCALLAPLFLFPVHWVPYYVIALYHYYHGIIDHSGINFKAYWWQPWQPDAIFHDNHHQYFHVNFGFNCWVWDKLHGTYRRKDRVYTEDIFYGRGKALTEATQEELATDIQERQLENPKAYRNDNMEFALSDEDVRQVTAGKEANKSK